jgi:hypothetical protein
MFESPNAFLARYLVPARIHEGYGKRWGFHVRRTRWRGIVVIACLGDNRSMITVDAVQAVAWALACRVMIRHGVDGPFTDTRNAGLD